MAGTHDSSVLVGTWKLKSNHKVDEQGHVEPVRLGWANPSGWLIYGAEGRMMAFLASGDRDPIGYPEIDDTKRIQAHKTMASYTGTYEFYGDHVLHHVDLSWIPDWQGAPQRREVKLDGDTLTLTTPHGRRPDGSMARFQLVWQRVS